MRALVCLALATLAAACTSDPPPLTESQAAVFAREVDLELAVVAARNAMRYETTQIRAPEGATVRLVIDNEATTSPSMLHNVVVLVPGADVDKLGREAAGAPDFVPDTPEVITATPLARPRGKAAVVFTVPPAGEYPYVCTYPGHFQFMRGVLVSTPRVETARTDGGAEQARLAPRARARSRSR